MLGARNEATNNHVVSCSNVYQQEEYISNTWPSKNCMREQNKKAMSCKIEDKLPYMYQWKEFTLGIDIISLYRLKHETMYKSQEINHPLVKI
jgi:hypothetical protein